MDTATPSAKHMHNSELLSSFNYTKSSWNVTTLDLFPILTHISAQISPISSLFFFFLTRILLRFSEVIPDDHPQLAPDEMLHMNKCELVAAIVNVILLLSHHHKSKTVRVQKREVCAKRTFD